MISELFLAAVLSTSFSVRSPNDATKPLDYEYMVKAEKTDVISLGLLRRIGRGNSVKNMKITLGLYTKKVVYYMVGWTM